MADTAIRCGACLDTGYVCEEHPDHAWDVGEGCCGGAGMPCTLCCSLVPEDGRHSVVLGFIPDDQRPDCSCGVCPNG